MRAIDVILWLLVDICISFILLAIFTPYHFIFLGCFIMVWCVGYKINNWKIKELTKRGEIK